jgi:hypothetical protein
MNDANEVVVAPVVMNDANEVVVAPVVMNDENEVVAPVVRNDDEEIHQLIRNLEHNVAKSLGFHGSMSNAMMLVLRHMGHMLLVYLCFEVKALSRWMFLFFSFLFFFFFLLCFLSLSSFLS